MRLTGAERLEIAALIAEADDCATRRDATAYAALFDVGARMTGVQGSVAGRDAIERRVREVWAAEPDATLHLTVTPVVSAEIDDGEATARSALLVVDPTDRRLIAVQRVSHRLVRRGAGWSFVARDIG
ncbi:nuclear transport factor 2 family protein [Leifsonia sp. ZF2019]|uniref:nuclear transport factor 2 family protein n=1 Tax=Leifsonia sp. ZF2019 TaxID=2781978 RepID=UPI001CC083E8|nr:nuclear transport factor 2 family protein [Leifsonia sp. ZF2019]UAJ81048.1 nuclear transport factor 2 family protein [Leifsonia sp. ZF2019]